jgi:hypothetical protein
MVVATVAHVTCGALVLVTAVVLAIQIHHHAAPNNFTETAKAPVQDGTAHA